MSFNLNKLSKRIRDRYNQNKNTSCKQKQCDAVTSRQSRCRNCMGEKSLKINKKFCWTHNKHSPQIFYSRNGNVSFGFDERLLEDDTKWFADDAIISGLKLIYKTSSRELCFFAFNNNTFNQLFNTNGDKVAEGCIIILLYNKHFVCGLVGGGFRLVLFDTLLGQANNTFTQKCQEFFGFRDIIFSQNTIQQPNLNDCGPYSLVIAKDLSLNLSPENADYANVRRHVLHSLMTLKFLKCKVT